MNLFKCIVLSLLLAGPTSAAAGSKVTSDLPPALVQKTEAKPETKVETKVDVVKLQRAVLSKAIERIRADMAKQTGKKVTVKQVLSAKNNVNETQDAQIVIFDTEGVLVALVFIRARSEPWDVFPDSFVEEKP